MKKILISAFVVYIVTVILVVAGLKIRDRNQTFLDPQAQKPTEKVLAAEDPPAPPKKVIGFVPFWTMKDLSPDHYKDVDIAYFFSLPVLGNGEFDKTDPGWSRLADTPKIGKQQGLTITAMKQDDIAAIIKSPTVSKKVMTQTIAVMKKYNFKDLNVDFEYAGTPPSTLPPLYTRFIADFTKNLHEEIPGSVLSVDTLADAVWKVRLYNIAEIGQAADYVIVMAYDFTRLSSDNAGPVAPMFGKEKFEYDVYSTVTDYIKNMPPEKLLLGVPFYGYEWSTTDDNPYAPTTGEAALSTIKRSAEIIKQYNASVVFDDLSKTPWFSYYDQAWHQVWFENERSLGLKFDLVNQANLGGIAIWALGYEGNNSSLWGLIKDKIL